MALPRERVLVAAALSSAAAIGLWLTYATGMQIMMDDGMGMQMTVLPRGVLLFLMWWSMMMAMMLPSAAPAILTYGTISRKLPPAHPVVFALGYAAVWSAYAGAATILQYWLAGVAPLTGTMALASRSVGGGLLILAGFYQLSALKGACLTRCQSPLFYLAHHWRTGAWGALRMGLSHGAHCLGCCWALMLLLFYGGVMDFRWILGLAAYVAAEKLVPPRYRLAEAAAAALIFWGGAELAVTSAAVWQ